MKRVALLGSTGSIGRQTLEVIENLGSDYRVVALTAKSNRELLEKQVRRFNPELAVLSDEGAAAALKRSLSGSGCRVEGGAKGQITAARWPGADLTVVALVGFSGFYPTLAALEAGKVVALANKEALVVGGELLARRGLLDPEQLLPLDSEHSAIRQCLGGASPGGIERIWLTASGGPFLDWDEQRLARASPAEALAHPNWRMGPKITIDSATLMNKGFELIEAHWLFGVPLEKITVVIHPQSIVHSAVEFVDGSLIAQLGPPDMRLPIQYALSFPERRTNPWPRFSLFDAALTFGEPDEARFPCLELARRALRAGGTAPACLNAANEVAVENFLKGALAFTGIPRLLTGILKEHQVIPRPEPPQLEEADRWARRRAGELLNERTDGSGHC
ncbi:MAG: 1-deoxy-D-xylulose-5-phosphate reductoisomerase [Firmicutes bacterium]|nr:1-deoxy-D-xylulose-5-phosphate reductoisomerase [Bacillota bacterium]